LIGLFCCGPAVESVAQTRKIDSPEVLKQLLAMPAPTPRHAGPQVPQETVPPRPPDFYHRDKTPPDDAPIQDLIDYWQRWADNGRDPAEAVSKRLLEACVAEPEILPTLLNVLPDDDSTPTKVKNIFDKAQTDPDFNQEWRDKVKRWLVFNSTYFLDELLALAHKARDNQKNGGVDKEEAIWALADLSWTNAEPLLRGLIASGQPRATALALSVYYEHAIEEKDLANEERYRRDLQAIAVNRNQPGYARNLAIETLASGEWSGVEDWYLGLFQDETLLDLGDAEYSLSPLLSPFTADMKKWVPIMTRLIESKDINVRSAAAACLVTVDVDEETNKKALTPLLPWLMNPAWINDASGRRWRLIQNLGTVKIPESVPGLISVIENDDSDPAYARGFAAQSLVLYQDQRAVPALRKALAKEKDEGQRQRLIKGLLGSNGLSDAEQLEALEAYASKIASAETRMDFIRYRGPQEEPLSPTLSIGRFLGQSRETPSESLINAVLTRAEELKSDNAPLAGALLEIAHQWQGQQVELDIIRRINNGSADSGTIAEAIQRKDKMQEGLRAELQGLASVAGAAQGIGAVLLNDPTLAQGVLNSEDEPAQIALLACSRLTQTALPVELIGPLLRRKNELLLQAAETYLLADDSPEARDLLWQRHPNEAFVTGWRENFMYGAYNYEALVKSEDQLRAELLKENGPTEIIAFVSNFGSQGSVLRIYPDKAVYTEHEDPARYRERTVPLAEVAALKDFLSVGGYADSGPTLGYCHHGCPATELLTMTKAKGRRVFHQGGDTDWLPVQERFTQLGAGGKVHYKLEEEIKGLEVLYAGEVTVDDVARQGNELRILVERSETKEESEERQATYDSEDADDDEELETQQIRRRIELNKARFSWRVFANDQPGSPTTAPDFYVSADPSRFITGDENDLDWENNVVNQKGMVTADSIVFAQSYDGLWRQFAGTKPVRIGDENAMYLYPIVTRDGRWVIVSKAPHEANEPSHLVRLNLQTGREFRINVPQADQLIPLAALPAINKVLVKRAKAEYAMAGLKPNGPEQPEYFLIEPATGVARPVSGEFTPLQQNGNRFLQAGEKPDEFWAAIPDDKKNQTQIGRYSLKDFSFKPVTTVPQLIFDSMSMWVDASQKKVYVVYKGQLLRLPLESSPPK
jgi:hypothetical protein